MSLDCLYTKDKIENKRFDRREQLRFQKLIFKILLIQSIKKILSLTHPTQSMTN